MYVKNKNQSKIRSSFGDCDILLSNFLLLFSFKIYKNIYTIYLV